MKLPSLCLLTLLVTLPAACGGHHEEEDSYFGSAFPDRHPDSFPEMSSSAVLRAAPEFQADEIFPCSDCHDPDFMETDPTVRDLEDPHDTMPTFTHGAGRLWCMDCHDAEDRDTLRLASGATLEFEEAPTLCGQCHSEQYRDWVGGAHGKRLGHWQEGKPQEVLVCANCHDAHAPQFTPIKPMPAPKRPEVTK
jgi:formate-dependent nitrite reductase cytochrome c552 subunit